MIPRKSAAVAFAVASLALAGTAPGQQRINQQGDALDANNRVGESRSYGSPRNAVNDRFRLNNALITRDVTAGRAFRDIVPYASDRSFRDFTAGRFSSSFAGSASGVTPSGVVINNAQTVQPYYGSARIVQPPPDYARLPGTGGYVPQSAVRPLDSRVDPRTLPGYAGRASAFDPRLNLRLGGDADRTGLSYIDPVRGAVPASPLLYPEATAQTGLFISPYTQLARDARLEPLTPQRLAELRSELLEDDETPLAESEPGARPAEGADSTSGRSELGARQTDSRAEGTAPISPTAGGMRQRLDEAIQQHSGVRLTDPAQQSTQYAQLEERLRRFRESGALDATRKLGAQRQPGSLSAGAAQPTEPEPDQRAPTDGQRPQVPGVQVPGVQVPSLQQPGGQPARVPGLPDFLPPIAPRAYPVPGAPTPGAEPVEIRSLADGMTSPTLRRMYQQAEQLMAEGRYVSAIARYEAADRLVPNQPLTSLGRAVAELGAGYFRRSAASLRQGFAQNPELLMARINLANFIGAKRLAEVTQTLQERLAAEQDPDPAFLLAFIAYHGQDRAEAARLLSLAEDRSGDFFYSEIAAHWGLRTAPTTRPASQP